MYLHYYSYSYQISSDFDSSFLDKFVHSHYVYVGIIFDHTYSIYLPHQSSSVRTDNNSSNVLAIQEAASARKGHHYTTASPTTKEYRQAAEAIAEAREAKQVKRRSHHYPDMARTNYMENRWSSIYSDTELYARVSRKNKD